MDNLENQNVNEMSSSSVSVILLWKASTIAGITLLSYLISRILAAMNWYQMRLRQKAPVHLLGGAWMMFVLGLLEFEQLAPGLDLLVFIFVLSVMIVMARYLFICMRRKIAKYRTSEHQVLEAQGCLGLLVWLSVGLLYRLSFTLLFRFVPSLIIGAVLFLLTVFILLVPAGESVF